jgi:hypothetical protein
MSSPSHTDQELKDALASLATIIPEDINDDCQHIHGFEHTASAASTTFSFKEDHELSMLQTITARRVLDYNALLVCFLYSILFVFD